ncbi:AN1-type zinc finger protein 2B-like protein [Gonapodya prolifera JEL478]|uniref:AN1-type zinc finger protein 2B-like protein n=1 Tax=Gonapodya prolifera (strain JEL478) TaxID=1344416 RepID=A0A139AM99_GONPJ|nr:AN1-type zinc finger protein 2B-like protein [Gonapodya prolifera JEL478]|eukprot:KXS17892.1 AN1-type zinc finger protein 2B-like protein [Gonapodya prolifera JEL478]
MELPHLGKYCQVDNCHQLDFLPFTCPHCSIVTCLDHRAPEHHRSCTGPPSAIAVECPLCKVPVVNAKGETLDAAMERHIVGGCKKERAKVKCSAPGCRKSEWQPVNCKGCRQNFCFSHRFPTDHKCARLAQPTTAINRRAIEAH